MTTQWASIGAGRLHLFTLSAGLHFAPCGLKAAAVILADTVLRCTTCARANEALLDPLRFEARRRWDRSTPYRLGLLVGKYRLAAASPYSTSRTARNFAAGVAHGAAMEWHD